MPDFQRIAVLGAGNIGAALISGMLRAGAARPEQLVATVGRPDRAEKLSGTLGIRVSAGGNLEAIDRADAVILAVKSAMLPQLLQEIRWGLRDDRVLISLAASFPLDVLAQLLGRRMPIFRAMPNIAVMVGEGVTCVAHNQAGSPEQVALVEKIFSAVGEVCWLEERQLHAAAALSVSGPAYVYMFLEAMIDGGLKMGLPLEVSKKLAEQTVMGAARLVQDTGQHPALLRTRAITPGGETIAALHELEKRGLRSMVLSAIETAARRSRRLAAEMVRSLGAQP